MSLSTGEWVLTFNQLPPQPPPPLQCLVLASGSPPRAAAVTGNCILELAIKELQGGAKATAPQE